MAGTSQGPALLRIAIGFAVGATIGFAVANSMVSTRPAPAPGASGRPAEGSAGGTGGGEAGDDLSEEELRRAMAAVDDRPGDFEAQFKMGEALLRIARRPADAVRYYERATALQPRNTDALVGLGDSNFAAALADENDASAGARLDAARAAYERALVIVPGSAGLHAALGSTYAMRNPPVADKARASFERALAIDPKNALARRGLADLDSSATNGNAARAKTSETGREARAGGR